MKRTPIKINPCKHCGGTDHTSIMCFKKARNGINKVGKQYKTWSPTRKAWLLRNPPNTNGYYICHLCKKPVHHTQVTLDHIKTRSRHPELRHRLDNLAPAHWACNTKRGSKSLDK